MEESMVQAENMISNRKPSSCRVHNVWNEQHSITFSEKLCLPTKGASSLHPSSLWDIFLPTGGSWPLITNWGQHNTKCKINLIIHSYTFLYQPPKNALFLPKHGYRNDITVEQVTNYRLFPTLWFIKGFSTRLRSWSPRKFGKPHAPQGARRQVERPWQSDGSILWKQEIWPPMDQCLILAAHATSTQSSTEMLRQWWNATLRRCKIWT